MTVSACQKSLKCAEAGEGSGEIARLGGNVHNVNDRLVRTCTRTSSSRRTFKAPPAPPCMTGG